MEPLEAVSHCKVLLRAEKIRNRVIFEKA